MSIKYTDLTFPQGSFSHTTLAAFNGYLGDGRKKIWTAYQTAISEGIIKSTGETLKSGKGKAAALWIVSDTSKVKMSTDSVPVPVVMIPVAGDLVADKPPKQPKIKKEKKPVEVQPVVTSATPPSENVSENVETVSTETPFVSEMVAPATAPIVTATVITVVEVDKLPPAKPEDLKVCVTPAGLGEITVLKETCPFCKTPLLTATTSAGGTRVWCGVNDFRICSCSENPYGYSNNVKNAIEILHQKFWNNRPEAKA